jgi:hypothetical protein
MKTFRRTSYSIILSGTILCAQPSGSIWVAALRSDGIISPVAQFVGGHWTGPISVPTFSDIENISDTWYCWTATDDSAELILGEAVYFESFGEDTGWGLLTNYCPRMIENNVDPFPKAGFALSNKCPATGMVSLDTMSSDWNILSGMLRPLFDSLETATLVADRSILSNLPSIPSSETVRKSVKWQSARITRTKHPLDGMHFFRFEVGKHYPTRGCFVTVMLQGWAVKKASEYKLADEDLSFGDCDGKGLNDFIQPLGVFKYANRIFTIVDIIPYEGAYLQIWELSDEGVEIRSGQQ